MVKELYTTVISTFSFDFKTFLAQQISISMYSRLFLDHLFLSVETLTNRYKRLQMILLQENHAKYDRFWSFFLPSQGFIFRKSWPTFQVSILDFDRQRFPVSLNLFRLLLFQALRLKEIIVGRRRYKPVLQYGYNFKLYLRLLCIYKALTLKKKTIWRIPDLSHRRTRTSQLSSNPCSALSWWQF